MVESAKTGVAEASNSFVQGRAAYAADILALSRATIEAMQRALRCAPEVRENRLLSRWPLDLEDVLFELETTATETSIVDLASRMGASPAQLRSTALRLQRMSLVRVNADSVALTGSGRQKLARLEMARSAVLRRIAEGIEVPMSENEALQVIRFLRILLDRTEAVAEDHTAET